MKQYYILFVFLILTSCQKTDFDLFNDNILSFVKNDKRIDEKEYKILVKDIQGSDEKGFEKFKNGKSGIDDEEVVQYILKYLSAKKQNFTADDICPLKNKTKPKKFNLNVYLENSASMDGYVRGATEFETATYNLLGDFKISGICDSLNLNYINKSIPYQKKNALDADIQDFIEKLEPSVFRQRGGDRSVSDLKNILNTVLKSVDNKNAAVLISDFVFSPGKKANAEDYLNNQGVGIKIDFASKLHDFDLSAVILQLQSNFDGMYYDKTDTPIPFKGKRPYYIWIFGNSKQISAILDTKILDNIKGGSLNKLVLQSIKKTNDPNYKILYSPKIGSFSAKELNDKIISDASASKENQNKGLFGFNVAVDFSGNMQDSRYFLDTANYVLSNKKYQLEIETITDKGNPSLSGFTHLLKLRTNELRDEDLQIEIVGKTPNWVYDSSSTDDSNILHDNTEQQKTFGLQYLVEGINDAFYPRTSSNTINTITIKIKK